MHSFDGEILTAFILALPLQLILIAEDRKTSSFFSQTIVKADSSYIQQDRFNQIVIYSKGHWITQGFYIHQLQSFICIRIS